MHRSTNVRPTAEIANAVWANARPNRETDDDGKVTKTGRALRKGTLKGHRQGSMVASCDEGLAGGPAMSALVLEPEWKRALSDRDLSKPGVATDARHELDRAGNNPEALAAWAAKWGRNALDAAEPAEGIEGGEVEALEKAEADFERADKLSDEAIALIARAQSALDALDDADDLDAAKELAKSAWSSLEDADEKLQEIGQ